MCCDVTKATDFQEILPTPFNIYLLPYFTQGNVILQNGVSPENNIPQKENECRPHFSILITRFLDRYYNISRHHRAFEQIRLLDVSAVEI